MGLNKKAIIFTMIAVLMSLLFTIIFAPNYQLPYDYENDATRLRIISLNQFADDFENYVEFALDLASYRVMEEMTERAARSTTIDFEKDYKSCITISKLSSGTDCNTTVENITIYQALDKIRNLSIENLSIQLDYKINNIEITQENPWNLRAKINITYTITDPYATWTRTKEISTDVPIEGLKDPIYHASGGTLSYNNTFNQSKVAITEWDQTKLQEFYNERKYRYNPRAPSFIDRVERNLIGNSTCCGIESLVDFTDPGFVVNRTYVDYEFISGNAYNCQTELKKIRNFIPADFTLDINRLIEFKINATEWFATSCT